MADQLMQHVSISWLLWIGSGLLVHALVYWRQYLPSFTRDVYKYGKLRSESDWSWMIPSVPKTQGGQSGSIYTVYQSTSCNENPLQV